MLQTIGATSDGELALGGKSFIAFQSLVDPCYPLVGRPRCPNDNNRSRFTGEHMQNEPEPAKADVPNVTGHDPYRLGIVVVGDELQSPALKLFILEMNRIQRQFEYEFIPDGIVDELLVALAQTTEVDREKIREIARDFPDRFNGRLQKTMKGYNIADTRLPNYFVVVSDAHFTDGFYNMRVPGISVIALGDWKRSMSPPSIIEFIQTLIVREAVAAICPPLRGSIHFGSKACICDFNQNLADVRLKVISGFVCSYCRDALDASGHKSIADEVELVLSKGWIGDLGSNTSVASTIAKLGVNLFVTRGLTPTLGERFVGAIREDGVKELIKSIYAIILAGLLFYLGWKAG
jgi:hypothetical protein